MTTLKEIKTLEDKREVFEKIIEQIECNRLWQIGYYYSGLFVLFFSEGSSVNMQLQIKELGKFKKCHAELSL